MDGSELRSIVTFTAGKTKKEHNGSSQEDKSRSKPSIRTPTFGLTVIPRSSECVCALMWGVGLQRDRTENLFIVSILV